MMTFVSIVGWSIANVERKMTDKQKEAMKLALEAICGSGDFLFNWHDCEPNNEREMQSYQATLAANEKAFTAIKAALAEQPAQHRHISYVCPQCYWSLEGQPAIKQDLTPEQPAQPQQEPVAIVDANDEGYWAEVLPDRSVKVGQPLYTSPPASKPWVWLTDREIDDLYCEHHDEYGFQLSATGYERAIEAKLREKNA